MKDETNIVVERQAFSIPEFCVRNRICNSTFHKLKAQGLGPLIMHLGGAQRISIEAERNWRAARERPTGAEAERIEREAKKRAPECRRMAKLAVMSPKHVSKRKAKSRGA